MYTLGRDLGKLQLGVVKLGVLTLRTRGGVVCHCLVTLETTQRTIK